MAELPAIEEVVEALERHDRFAPMRNRLGALAQGVSEWAGIPIPIEGERLVVHPSYPFADVVSGEEPAGEPFDIVNVFWSRRLRCEVAICWEDGRLVAVKLPAFNHVHQQLRTLGCAVAWGLVQEHIALDRLGRMLGHHAYKTYLLTGSFLESSPRSGLTYMFRKLRPTLALSSRTGSVRVIAALCMHPIAYYADSWAGAMCPTDDVIAHLAMMRGDEARYWRKSSQHSVERPEAGV